MTLPIEDLTPREIVAELDRHIVGQAAAKKAVAVALRNRFRRQMVPEGEREEIVPKNILMIGPTGVGKTEIARRLAQLAKAPFIKVEATKFTEVGYVGRDVESMIRDLVSSAVRMVEREQIEAVRPEAEEAAMDTLADLLEEQYPPKRPPRKAVAGAPSNPLDDQAYDVFGYDTVNTEEADEEQKQRWERLRKEIIKGKHDEKEIEIEVEEASNPFMQVFTPGGMEEMGLDVGGLLNPFGRSGRSTRRLPLKDAKDVLTEQEAQRRIDHTSISRDAIERAEQTGIIFLDELDKVAIKSGRSSGPDVSREGVQRDLLPIIEGSTVQTKFGSVKTDHMLFVAAGAFHESKPSDLIPELQGRLPIRVELESLSEQDFERILHEPQSALTKQYQRLLAVEGVTLEFTDDGIKEIARLAAVVNEKTENIGARRLQTLMERLLEEIMFDAPEVKHKKVKMDASAVQARLKDVVDDSDLSRYIL